MFLAARKAVSAPEESIKQIEKDWRLRTRFIACKKLRAALSLDDFSKLMFSLPLAEYPKLSRLLPSMASTEVQARWTGQTGDQLLRGTLAFVCAITDKYRQLSRKPIDQLAILDYGCGYGRITRLMYYFTAPNMVFGIDPFDKSIEICHAQGMVDNFKLSDYLPTKLPLDRKDFGLIYAFSVFTHLSRRATLVALAACRQHIALDGVLVITIRPPEYWDAAPDVLPENRPAVKQQHVDTGFAFVPHNRKPIDGEVTYGDTSMSLN